MKLLNDSASSDASCPEEAVRAIAAPMHRTGAREAAQRLRRHRSLHRVEVVDVAGAVDRPERGAAPSSSPPSGCGLIVTSSSGSPRSHASESKSPKMWHDEHEASPLADVSSGVVEERPAGDDVRRLGVVQRVVLELGCAVARSITAMPLSKRVATYSRPRASSSARPAGPPPGTVDVAGAQGDRIEAVVLERRRRQHADLVRAEGRDVQRRAVARERQIERRRQAVVLLRPGRTPGRRRESRSRCVC